MPRERAQDYDDKARTILDKAAALFAKAGYPGSKLQDVAIACGATKSMLYHYFPTKDDLLFALLTEHLELLLADIERVTESGGGAEDRLRRFVIAYVQKSTESRQRHLSAMNDVKYLPKAKQEPILQLEREVVAVTSAFLAGLRPELPNSTVKTYTLLLLGMLNWTDLWFDSSGEWSADTLCDRISDLFLHGFKSTTVS